MTVQTGTEVMGDDGVSTRAALLHRLRRLAPWLLLGTLLFGTVLLASFGRSADGKALSPANPSPVGAMAVAEVLRSQGVEVIQPASLESALSALEDGDATLLLHDSESWLNSEQLQSLEGLANRLVLIEPTAPVLEVLASDITVAGQVPFGQEAVLKAQCALDDAVAAGTITGGTQTYAGARICFPAAIPAEDDAPGGTGAPDAVDSDEDGAPGGNVSDVDGATGSAPTGGSYVVSAESDVVVLGNGNILSNGGIEDEGNATLALRALGSTPALVWYQPTADDLAATGQPVNPLNLLPSWVNPLMLWLLITAVLAILWRSRRLGPLVSEPLPVVVRAAETAEGRARLYQDSRSVDRAASNLRSAALTRISARLRLPASGNAASVVAAAADNTGRNHAELYRLLHGFIPANDAELVRWSQELEALEKEIKTR